MVHYRKNYEIYRNVLFLAVSIDRYFLEELLPKREASHSKKTIALLLPVRFVNGREKCSHKMAKSLGPL